jgi:ubiquinone/menaquinone biosynthesis C-methylase UbiE/DNA-binding transcriptional ArsR family regulator
MNVLRVSLKILKVLGDETRLQLLLILQQSEFTVSELVMILEMHQSNISRHLSQLREAKLLFDRKEGTLVYYRWSELLRTSAEVKAVLKSSWLELDSLDELKARIQNVLDLRRQKTQNFFEGVAGRYHQLAQPGGGSEALIHAFASLVHADKVIDIGCGEGDLSLMLAKGCNQVYAIDLSDKMLTIVKERALDAGLSNVFPKRGDLERLPFDEEEVDLAVMSQVLHHAPSPLLAIEEMWRVLKKGGEFIILDLLEHKSDVIREQLGDLWFGFKVEQIEEWLRVASFAHFSVHIIPNVTNIPILMVKGQK